MRPRSAVLVRRACFFQPASARNDPFRRLRLRHQPASSQDHRDRGGDDGGLGRPARVQRPRRRGRPGRDRTPASGRQRVARLEPSTLPDSLVDPRFPAWCAHTPSAPYSQTRSKWHARQALLPKTFPDPGLGCRKTRRNRLHRLAFLPLYDRVRRPRRNFSWLLVFCADRDLLVPKTVAVVQESSENAFS
jgi:hypothetical protein